jgi:histidinol-phosphate aminotransferase
VSTRRELLVAAGTLAFASVAAPLATGAALARNGQPIRLSLNESAYGPSPRVAEAIERSLRDVNRYPDDVHTDALIQQIAAFEKVEPSQVVLGEVLEPLGLYLARARGGGTIVYSNPGYTALVDSSAPLGGKGVPVPLDARLENDLPALARAVSADTLAVSLINPHNPSGTVSDIAAFDAFVRDVGHRTLVVVDEAYLEYDDLEARSAVRLLREGANALVFRTLAKVYGLAGLSLGYALAPPALAADLRKWGIGAPHSLSRPALAAAGAALADQQYVATVRARTKAERERVTVELDRLKLAHTDSRGNFVFFHAPGAVDRIRAALTKRNVQIGRPFAPLDEWIRITIGRPEENTVVIAALKEAVG